MNSQMKRIQITNSILWASAMISASILKAPEFFTLVLLPALFVVSLTSIRSAGRKSATCQS